MRTLLAGLTGPRLRERSWIKRAGGHPLPSHGPSKPDGIQRLSVIGYQMVRAQRINEAPPGPSLVMLIGVLAGLTTGALWGLTFIAPLAVRPFSGWDLTLARYGVFGLASLLLMIWPRFRPGPLTARQLAIGLMLGGLGFTAYVCLIFFAVNLAGPVIPPLIVGTTPIVMALVTNRNQDKVLWASLAFPLGLIAVGVMTVNLAALSGADIGTRDDVVLGAVCAVAAMAVWIGYAVINKGVTQGPEAPDTLRWTGVQGIGAALGGFALLPFTSFMPDGQGWAMLGSVDKGRQPNSDGCEAYECRERG